MVNLSTEGLFSVSMVVGIGPGGVVSEYMCQSGSTTASRCPTTLPPDGTGDRSSVSFHCTWLNFSLCPKTKPSTTRISSNKRRITSPRCSALAQLFFDAQVHVTGCKIGRDTDGILDGVGIRTSVTNDTHAFDAQQRRAAVLGVIDP